MKKPSQKILVGLALCSALLGGLAFAAAAIIPELQIKWFQSGLLVMPKARAAQAVATAGGNIITTSYGGCTTYDFPALVASNTTNANGNQCATSWNVTATGVKLTDPCFASNNFGADGGATIGNTAAVTCRATAADTIVFDACSKINDGGTVDLTDAGFCYRTFGAQ